MTKYVIRNWYGLYFIAPKDLTGHDLTSDIKAATKYESMTAANIDIIENSMINVTVEPVEE